MEFLLRSNTLILGHFSISFILEMRFDDKMAVSRLIKSFRKEMSLILKLLKLIYFKLAIV